MYIQLLFIIMKRKKYYKTVHEIISTGHWITESISQELKIFGVSEPQYNVLRVLSDHKGKPVTVREITKRMVQRSSNVTRIIDKLLVKEYVKRKECSSNRRKMDITITDEGISFLKKLDKKVHTFHYPMMDNLSGKEADALRYLIEKMKGK